MDHFKQLILFLFLTIFEKYIVINALNIYIQDTGSCISINYIKVYYEYCGVTVKNLATFDKTTTGPDLTSLEESKGQCVANAVLKVSFFFN